MTSAVHQPPQQPSTVQAAAFHATAVPASGAAFGLARRARRVLRRVPVWAWRALMHSLGPGEVARFNAAPVTGVDHSRDIDFVGDGIRAHRLDVITPARSRGAHADGPLPVYVYFHGGGWTSGDKASLTKYCASQASGGMVAVNVNYRRAPRFQMEHVLHDANAALAWVREHIQDYGGDPGRIVLGGDSAGGQIAALLTAASFRPELASHYALEPATPAASLRGLVQHCSVVDFSVFFERGFVLSLRFVRMLLPRAARSPRRLGIPALRTAARFLSPIEWLDPRFPPVFVTTSERDFFYAANLNFIERLRQHGVYVDTLVYGWDAPNTEHTWQQDFRHAESQEVYRRLHMFVRSVAGA